MSAETNNAVGHELHTIQVSGLSLVFHDVTVSTLTPTGKQLAAAAGYSLEGEATVMEVLANGELEGIRPSEAANLHASTRKFVIVQSDRIYKFLIDETPYEWPSPIISGGQLRKLGHVPTDLGVYLADAVERVIHNHDLVDLDAPGVERFKTRQHEWKLNVQGVVLVVHHPTIVVRDAIKDAGFDPTTPWIMVLRVQGQGKREVGLSDVIDLRTAGIEKLRLTPKEVVNGEAPLTPRRMFDLLDVDERFLNGMGLRWETVTDHGRRWLLIHDYPVPTGFTAESTVLALEIPLTYPGAQIDMFYTYPALALKSGRAIPNADVSQVIHGITFNRWSRHRGQQSPWQPATDNVATHLALVESAMVKETGA